MGMWQIIQQRSDDRKVLVQSKQWKIARQGMSAIMAARYRASRDDDEVTAEHFRLTRYRLGVLDDGAEFEWLSLDETERLSIAFDPEVYTEFRASRRGVRQVAASVIEVDAAGRDPGSVELAVLRSGDDEGSSRPDEFMGEPASVSLLEQQD